MLAKRIFKLSFGPDKNYHCHGRAIFHHLLFHVQVAKFSLDVLGTGDTCSSDVALTSNRSTTLWATSLLHGSATFTYEEC